MSNQAHIWPGSHLLLSPLPLMKAIIYQCNTSSRSPLYILYILYDFHSLLVYWPSCHCFVRKHVPWHLQDRREFEEMIHTNGAPAKCMTIRNHSSDKEWSAGLSSCLYKVFTNRKALLQKWQLKRFWADMCALSSLFVPRLVGWNNPGPILFALFRCPTRCWKHHVLVVESAEGLIKRSCDISVSHQQQAHRKKKKTTTTTGNQQQQHHGINNNHK